MGSNVLAARAGLKTAVGAPSANFPGYTGLIAIRRKRRERGQSMVELALVLPVFLVIVMGIVDFSLGLKEWISITNEAREGARYAAVSCALGADDSAGVESKVHDATADVVLKPGNITAVDVTNCTAGAGGENVTVRVDYDYALITPLGGLLQILGGDGLAGKIALSSHSEMRLE